MRKIVLLFILITSAYLLNAQSVGIGTTTPNASAQLDISSTTKGLLIPRMTGAQRAAIPAAAVGMLVIQTNTETSPPSSPGLYLREQVGLSLVWRRIARTDEISGGSSTWTVNGIDQYSNVVGNVGIGTSSGLIEKLSVKGNIFVTHVNANDLVNGGNKAVLNLHGASTGLGVVNFLEPDTTVGASISYSSILNSLTLRNANNTNQLFLRSDGTVGIGTGSPTKALDVVGSIRSRDTIRADNDIEAGVDIRAGDDIIAAGTVSGASLNSTGVLTVAGNSLFNGTAVVNGELSTNTGVTINNAAGILNLKNGSTDKAFVQLSGDNLRVGTYGTNTNGKFVIRTGSNDWVYVDGSGNMGLDIASPLSKIHIASGNDAGLGTHGYLMLGPVTGSNLIFDNNEIIARTNGQTGSLILQNDGGSVRIGNVAVPSGYKFAINGKMICEEVKVKLASSGWPDYVFADTYKLKPLNEVEKFITQNRHLPNIPSAKEVEENGIEIGDMQKRMMEKIEELTLYVIELEKKINELKAVKEK